MRKSTAYRPAACESLEDRSVPTSFGGLGGFGGFFGGLVTSPTTQDTQAVRQAFETFERAYVKDVRTILFQAGTTTAPTTAQQTAFNTQVGIDLGTLNSAIGTDIKNLAGTNPALAGQISGEVLGTATTTLQNELATLTMPTATGNRAISRYLSQGLRDIETTAYRVTQQVRSATPPAGSIGTATVKSVLQGVSTAVMNFNQSYANAVSANLTSVGKNTAIPAANQTAFTAAVTTAVQKLNTDVQAAVAPLLTSIPTLSTTLSTDILGPKTTPPSTTDTSLQGRLTGLTLPTSTNFFPMRIFRINSAFILGRADTQVVHDITTAVNTFNASAT